MPQIRRRTSCSRLKRSTQRRRSFGIFRAAGGSPRVLAGGTAPSQSTGAGCFHSFSKRGQPRTTTTLNETAAASRRRGGREDSGRGEPPVRPHPPTTFSRCDPASLEARRRRPETPREGEERGRVFATRRTQFSLHQNMGRSSGERIAGSSRGPRDNGGPPWGPGSDSSAG
jgi:hypothetical protein